MDRPTQHLPSEPKLSCQVFGGSLLELLAPRGPRFRLALTRTGVAEVHVADRFAEQILDVHWQEAAAYLSTGDPTPIAEFAGLVIDGRTLASTRDDVVACLRMAED